MANELTNAEANALKVSYEVMGSQVVLDLPFVKKYLVRGAAEMVSDQEVVFFMNLCRAQRLNPLTGNEVYLIKYSKSDPAQVVVGKGAYMRRAFEHPEYLGKEDGIVVSNNGSVLKKEGCCLYPGETLLGGWCKVYYKRGGVERHAYKEVSLGEYDKGMSNWKSKPATMINKVAVSQCVREAFPKEYEGLYSEEEMVASGAIPAEIEIDPTTGEVTINKPEEEITQEQRQQIFRRCREIYPDAQKSQAFIKELLAKEGRNSTENLPISVFERIMKELDEEDCRLNKTEAVEDDQIPEFENKQETDEP